MGALLFIIAEIKPEKFYIGSAVNFVKRQDRHRTSLKHNWHPNSILQNHYNKYGKDDLTFDVLEFDIDTDKLLNREQFYIDTLNPTFNILRIAGINLGYIPSEETRRKLSEASKNRVFSLEELKELSEKMKGNTYRLGVKHTPETIEQMSIQRKGNQYAKGAVRTQEFKDNLSNILKGKPLSKRAMEGSKLILSKPVNQFTKENVFIKEWVIMNDAKTNLNIQHISKCCKGSRNTAGGFKWVLKMNS